MVSMRINGLAIETLGGYATILPQGDLTQKGQANEQPDWCSPQRNGKGRDTGKQSKTHSINPIPW